MKETLRVAIGDDGWIDGVWEGSLLRARANYKPRERFDTRCGMLLLR